jgi:hypothetical protein
VCDPSRVEVVLWWAMEAPGQQTAGEGGATGLRRGKGSRFVAAPATMLSTRTAAGRREREGVRRQKRHPFFCPSGIYGPPHTPQSCTRPRPVAAWPQPTAWNTKPHPRSLLHLQFNGSWLWRECCAQNASKKFTAD